MQSSTRLIDLHKLCKFSPKEELLAQLCEWGLVPPQGSLSCRRCGQVLRICVDSKTRDGWGWTCGRTVSVGRRKKSRCRYTLAFRKGTFFEGSQLDMLQILGFVYMWVNNFALKIIESEMTMSYHTILSWAAYCREVLLFGYLLCPERLGGPGTVVEINEAELGRRKHPKAQHLEGEWLFGCYERGAGKVLMLPVESCDADALVPIIQKWILPGTTIISDLWRATNCLSNEEYLHLADNHSITFEDPDTTSGNKSLESTWRVAKITKDSRGRIKAHIGENLARYIFFKRCRDQKLDRTREFFRLAGILFDPRCLNEEAANNETPTVADEKEGCDDYYINFE